MPGQQQRHQLVAQLPVGHRLPVLVARPHEQRQDVVALGQVRLAPAPLELVIDDRVQPVQRPPDPAGGALEARPAQREQHYRNRMNRLEQPGDRSSERLHALRLHPEHRPQDHLERDPARALLQAHRPAHRPARHVAPGGLDDHVLVLAHPLAVEGRQKQLALAQVLRPGQHDHRPRPHHRRDRRAARRRRSHLSRRGEHRLDRLRVGDHHELHPARGERQRERIAQCSGATVHHPRRRHRPRQRLHDRRRPRARRQRRRSAGASAPCWLERFNRCGGDGARHALQATPSRAIGPLPRARSGAPLGRDRARLTGGWARPGGGGEPARGDVAADARRAPPAVACRRSASPRATASPAAWSGIRAASAQAPPARPCAG